MSVEALAAATIMSQTRGARGIISIEIPEKLKFGRSKNVESRKYKR